MFRNIETELAPKAIGPYSQAVQLGDWLFLSGQIGLHPKTGQLVEGGFIEEARQVLENIKGVLTAAGYEVSDVISADVFLTDMTQFGSFNSIYESFFGTHRPARAVVEVKGLPRGAMVEVKCIACKQP